MFSIFETEKQSYRCKLNTRALVDIEKELGDNPLNILVSIFDDGAALPKLDVLMCILYHSLKGMNHGVSRSDVYDIFDDYLATGKGIQDFSAFLCELFQNSGLLASTDSTSTSEDTGKN